MKQMKRWSHIGLMVLESPAWIGIQYAGSPGHRIAGPWQWRHHGEASKCNKGPCLEKKGAKRRQRKSVMFVVCRRITLVTASTCPLGIRRSIHLTAGAPIFCSRKQAELRLI